MLSPKTGRSTTAINLAVFLAALAYGTTFPLLAIRLEETGASGLMIGLNASMPALGWILGSLIASRLQAAFGIRLVSLGFLLIGIAAFAGQSASADYWSSTILRFFFGGSVGMFFRSIEYWINGITADARRGRDLATYNVIYVLGLVLGTLAQPQLGTSGWLAFGPILAGFVFSALVIGTWPNVAAPAPETSGQTKLSTTALMAAPVPFLAIFAYGLYEDIPVYLTPIYAIKNGMSPEISAYAVTAACLGNLLFPIPVAMISDRIGRTIPLIGCSLAVVATSAAIPFALTSTSAFLSILVVWAGCAGATYSIALAILGDQFSGRMLITANATFGIVYACGALCGPLINGAALETLHTHGVMVSAAAIFSLLILTLAGLNQRAPHRRTS